MMLQESGFDIRALRRFTFSCGGICSILSLIAHGGAKGNDKNVLPPDIVEAELYSCREHNGMWEGFDRKVKREGSYGFQRTPRCKTTTLMIGLQHPDLCIRSIVCRIFQYFSTLIMPGSFCFV